MVKNFIWIYFLSQREEIILCCKLNHFLWNKQHHHHVYSYQNRLDHNFQFEFLKILWSSNALYGILRKWAQEFFIKKKWEILKRRLLKYKLSTSNVFCVATKVIYFSFTWSVLFLIRVSLIWECSLVETIVSLKQITDLVK